MAFIGIHFSFGLFIGSPVGVFLGIPPWLSPSEVLLGGLLLWIFPLVTSIITFVYLLVWLVGLLFMNYIVNKLNPVRHDLLNLWRTFLACWIVWGKNLPCLILFTILFWGCMPYGICSVPFMVLFTRRLLHVVTMMSYSLAYCEPLFLSLVGLMLCGCNLILKICGCRLIGEEDFMIFWENLDWLLPAVVICTTIEIWSLYLRCTILIWSVF